MRITIGPLSGTRLAVKKAQSVNREIAKYIDGSVGENAGEGLAAGEDGGRFLVAPFDVKSQPGDNYIP